MVISEGQSAQSWYSDKRLNSSPQLPTPSPIQFGVWPSLHHKAEEAAEEMGIVSLDQIFCSVSGHWKVMSFGILICCSLIFKLAQSQIWNKNFSFSHFCFYFSCWLEFWELKPTSYKGAIVPHPCFRKNSITYPLANLSTKDEENKDQTLLCKLPLSLQQILDLCWLWPEKVVHVGLIDWRDLCYP